MQRTDTRSAEVIDHLEVHEDRLVELVLLASEATEDAFELDDLVDDIQHLSRSLPILQAQERQSWQTGYWDLPSLEPRLDGRHHSVAKVIRRYASLGESGFKQLKGYWMRGRSSRTL